MPQPLARTLAAALQQRSATLEPWLSHALRVQAAVTAVHPNQNGSRHSQLISGPKKPGRSVQRVVESARAGQREGLVVQGPGLHHVRENFVERADLLNRPLRTRTVGGVGAGG